MTEQRNLSFQDYEALVTRLTELGMSAAAGYVVSHKDELEGAFARLHNAHGGGTSAADRQATGQIVNKALRFEVHRRVLELLKSDPPKDLDETVAALGVDAARELLVEHCKN